MAERQPWRTTIPKEYVVMLEQARFLFDVETDPLIMARMLNDWRAMQDELVRMAVRDARKEGRSWEEIGAALKVSRQQAHRKYAGEV